MRTLREVLVVVFRLRKHLEGRDHLLYLVIDHIGRLISGHLCDRTGDLIFFQLLVFSIVGGDHQVGRICVLKAHRQHVHRIPIEADPAHGLALHVLREFIAHDLFHFLGLWIELHDAVIEGLLLIMMEKHYRAVFFRHPAVRESVFRDHIFLHRFRLRIEFQQKKLVRFLVQYIAHGRQRVDLSADFEDRVGSDIALVFDLAHQLVFSGFRIEEAVLCHRLVVRGYCGIEDAGIQELDGTQVLDRRYLFTLFVHDLYRCIYPLDQYRGIRVHGRIGTLRRAVVRGFYSLVSWSFYTLFIGCFDLDLFIRRDLRIRLVFLFASAHRKNHYHT